MLTIFLLQILVACKDDCQNYKPKDNYNAIDESELSLVPYKGFDTLVFLRNNTDTITFYGSGKNKIITTESGDLGGCGPTSYEHNDNYRYTFSSNTIQDKIIIELIYPEYFNCYFKNKVFKIPMVYLNAPFNLNEIILNNVAYKDITFIPREPKDTLYYDNEVGMIKFGFQSGEQWTLIKK